MSAATVDQNERILNLIKDRMELGVERYGHGLRSNDDTRQWGTKENSWCEMALEEVLDGMVYMAAQIIRIQDTMRIFPISDSQDSVFDDYDTTVLPPRPSEFPRDNLPCPPSDPIIVRKLTTGERAPCLSPEQIIFKKPPDATG